MTLARIIPLLCLCMALISPPTNAAQLLIEAPWVAEAPPRSKVLAGYMTLNNPTGTLIEITRVTSADFSSIEIHRTVEQDGVARMLRQTHIEIAPHASFALSPGGYHLMLFNPTRALRDGDTTTLNFALNNGEVKTLQVPVKKNTGNTSSGNHSEHQH
jgi:copper(I)-binding protein